MLKVQKFPLSGVFAAALLAGTATGASALTIPLNGMTHGSGTAPNTEKVSLNATNLPPFVLEENNMGFHITSSTEGSFYSMCVDIGEPLLPLPNTYTHEANGTANGFTLVEAGRIAAVMQAAGFTSAHGFGAGNNTTKNFVALQMGVWNVLYDTDWSVTGGVFQQLTDTNGAQALANTWLTSASTITPTYNIHKLYSVGEQDLVFSVPEPSAYLMALPVLVMLSLVARRRRQGK